MKNQITEIALNVIMDLDSRENGLEFTNFVYDNHDWCLDLTITCLARYCEKYFHRIIKAETFDNENEIVKDILSAALDLVDWYGVAESLFDRVKPVE